MGKLDGAFSAYAITARSTNQSYIANVVDMLKLISKKDTWNTIPEVKEIDIRKGKFVKITKGDIIRLARYNKDELTDSQYEYIMKIWK